MLLTPSKSFRHCSLQRGVWVVFLEVKSMPGFSKSSYGGIRFLHICKLEWFKSKHIWVDVNVVICSQGPYMAVSSDRDLATLFCVQEKFNCPHTDVWRVHYFKIWVRKNQGFWLWNIACLLMYRINASLTIVSKSLYGTASPFSILNGFTHQVFVCFPGTPM